MCTLQFQCYCIQILTNIKVSGPLYSRPILLVLWYWITWLILFIQSVIKIKCKCIWPTLASSITYTLLGLSFSMYGSNMYAIMNSLSTNNQIIRNEIMCKKNKLQHVVAQKKMLLITAMICVTQILMKYSSIISLLFLPTWYTKWISRGLNKHQS